jgi:excisionase family DNA binding protein
MGLAQVKFESVDDRTREQANQLAHALEAAHGQRVTLQLEGRLADLVKNIVALLGRVGGIAYGGLSAELTPEQAGKVLGYSRPLVVRRMDDGRLPFRYEGAHRRCKLEDVLKLKVQEEKQTNALRALGEEIDEFDIGPAPRL